MTGDAGDASLFARAALNVISSLLFVLSFSRQGDRNVIIIVSKFQQEILFQVTWSDPDEGYGKHYFEFNH